jgi:UDP-N-acetylmuramoyl-L-alanyl-D-glutamate--2,6-diaminopimelate ligase
VIEDRAAAIEYAVSLAEAGDTVIILGKGHESGQEVNGVVTSFDDRFELAKAIEAKR